MRTLLLIIVFLIAVIGAAIAFTPLGYVLEKSGAANSGAGWAQAECTFLKGRISVLHIGGQPVGDVSLKLRPMSLLSLAPEYDVQWGGAGGKGSGVVKVSRGSVAARELRLQQEINSIEGLSAQVRAIGGTIRLSDGAITFTPSGCESASGQLSTDMLSKTAEQYGRQFGVIEGPLSCVENDVVIALSGHSERGDKVQVDARTSMLGASVFDTVIETGDTEVMFALSQVGFELRDGAWRYHYEAPGRLSR